MIMKICLKLITNNTKISIGNKKLEELEQNTPADSANLDNLEQYSR